MSGTPFFEYYITRGYYRGYYRGSNIDNNITIIGWPRITVEEYGSYFGNSLSSKNK